VDSFVLNDADCRRARDAQTKKKHLIWRKGYVNDMYDLGDFD
jgi:hypothetical protein